MIYIFIYVIVAGVLQGDTLAPYLFIICLDNVLITSIDKIKENGFELLQPFSQRPSSASIQQYRHDRRLEETAFHFIGQSLDFCHCLLYVNSIHIYS